MNFQKLCPHPKPNNKNKIITKMMHSPPRESYPQAEMNSKRARTRQGTIFCSICKCPCDVEEEIMCKSCEQITHYSCININKEFFTYFIKDKGCAWKCPPCILKTMQESDSKLSKNMSDMKELQNKYKALEKKMDDQEKKTQTIEGEMSIICETIRTGDKAYNKHFNQLQSQINQQKDDFQKELCYLQGRNSATNLVLTAVPYKQNENLKTYIIDIAKKFGIRINTTDINKANRLGELQASSANKPLPILYGFKQIGIRNQIFNSYIEDIKKKIYITQATIGLQSNDRIYINQHIPHCLNEIYKSAIALKKEGKLEQVTPKVNAIAIKKDGKWITIQTKTQLEQEIW